MALSWKRPSSATHAGAAAHGRRTTVLATRSVSARARLGARGTQERLRTNRHPEHAVGRLGIPQNKRAVLGDRHDVLAWCGAAPDWQQKGQQPFPASHRARRDGRTVRRKVARAHGRAVAGVDVHERALGAPHPGRAVVAAGEHEVAARVPLEPLRRASTLRSVQKGSERAWESRQMRGGRRRTTTSSGPSSDTESSPVATSQTLTRPSIPPTAASLPSLLNATALTESAWPPKTNSTSPVDSRHRSARSSPPPDSARSGSAGLRAHAYTESSHADRSGARSGHLVSRARA